MAISKIDTNAIANDAVTSTKIDDSQITLGFRNKIIGGNFSTNPWQRGTSFTGVTSAYTADRFSYNQSTTATVDISKTADAPTIAEAGVFTQDCLQLEVTTPDATIGSSEYSTVNQRVEGYNISDMGFGQSGTRYFTLSFWHKHTKSGTYCVSMQNSAGNRSYIAEYNQSSSDTWEKAELTIPVDTSGTWSYDSGVGLYLWFILLAGSTYQTTADSWQSGNYLGTSNQVNALDSTSNNFKIALVQLEAGQTATAFENRSVGQELELCQRYFEKSYNVDTAPGSSTETNSFRTLSPRTLSSTVDYMYSVQYKVKKRAGTSVVIYSTDGTSGSVRDISGGSNTTLRISLGGDSNLMAGFDIIDTRFYAFQWTAEAEL